MELKEKMKIAREAYGLSRADMSRLCGFGINGWGKYEIGFKPSMSNKKLIDFVLSPSGMYHLLDITSPYVKNKMGDRYFVACATVAEITVGIKMEVADFEMGVNDEYFDRIFADDK